MRLRRRARGGGSFSAGVVSALDAAGVRFDVIVGTSVGAVNGAALLHGYGRELPAMWLENLRQVRWFDARLLLRGRSPFLISEAMRLMVARYGDVARVRAHPAELLVSTTDWLTGENVLFSTKDERSAWTDEEVTRGMLASLAIPLVCTEKVFIRGRRYCDGALSNNFPVEALLARGCREVVVVDPSPLGAPDNAVTALLRAFAPLGRGLRDVPFPAARLAAGLFGPGLVDPEGLQRGLSASVRLRVVGPPRPLGYAALDFRNLDAIRGAIELGLETGARLAAEIGEGRGADARASAAA